MPQYRHTELRHWHSERQHYAQSGNIGTQSGDISTQGTGLEKVPISPWLVTVTHLRNYTNTAITDIARNSTLILPETPHLYCRKLRASYQYRQAECRCLRNKRWYLHIEWLVFERFMMFHNILRVFHDVLLVVHDVLRCITMFYKCFMMFYYV